MHHRSHAERQLARVVGGAVRAAIQAHPDYLTASGRRWGVSSIEKRVVGAVLGYARQALAAQDSASAGNRSGSVPAVDMDRRDSRAEVPAGGAPSATLRRPLRMVSGTLRAAGRMLDGRGYSEVPK